MTEGGVRIEELNKAGNTGGVKEGETVPPGAAEVTSGSVAEVSRSTVLRTLVAESCALPCWSSSFRSNKSSWLDGRTTDILAGQKSNFIIRSASRKSALTCARLSVRSSS